MRVRDAVDEWAGVSDPGVPNPGAPSPGVPNPGVEVFMLQRTLQAVFASGMYVFPGGRVDDLDGAAEMEDVCVGLSDARASELLGVSSGGLAYWVAAIRECFEEAGVLLARTADGDHVVDGHAALAERHGVHDGTVDLVVLCDQHHLVPAIDELVWVSHWITPMGEPRRFDTRFYLAPAPAEQTSVHDDSETIASLWVHPSEALERQAAGELMMMPPTITNLKMLATFTSVEHAMEVAHGMPTPECVLPKIRRNAEGGIAGVAMPGDADYDSLG
jgi:8-oxo-dGTP pyrophosphatase MutT (NUDIX family)